jgi:hypothetical protein
MTFITFASNKKMLFACNCFLFTCCYCRCLLLIYRQLFLPFKTLNEIYCGTNNSSYCSCHSNIKSISFRNCVISSMYEQTFHIRITVCVYIRTGYAPGGYTMITKANSLIQTECKCYATSGFFDDG